MNTRSKRLLQIGVGVGLLSLLVVAIASASDKPQGACGEGKIPNPARARIQELLDAATQPLQRAVLLQQLNALALCVDAMCPDGYHRDVNTGECVLTTPDSPDPGFDPFDPGTDEPPPDEPTECPPGYRRGVGGRCIRDFDIPEAPDTPPGNVDDILKPVPVPGAFYQVKKDDIFLGTKVSSGTDGKALSICYMALRRAAFEAARQIGELDDDDAWAHVNANAAKLRHEIDALRPYLDVIGCSWWNDESYASWRYAQGEASPNPSTGRAISLNPAHAPNLQRLRGTEPPARNVRLGTPAQSGTGSPTIANGQWRRYPLLWIPEIDLELFWSSGFETITAEGLTWDDSSSRAVPPPWVQIRGIFDATGTLAQGTVIGCGPSQKVVR